MALSMFSSALVVYLLLEVRVGESGCCQLLLYMTAYAVADAHVAWVKVKSCFTLSSIHSTYDQLNTCAPIMLPLHEGFNPSTRTTICVV